MNLEMVEAIEKYQGLLDTENAHLMPLTFVSFEDLVEAFRHDGEREIAGKLAERYIDFGPIHERIDEWTPYLPEKLAA